MWRRVGGRFRRKGKKGEEGRMSKSSRKRERVTREEGRKVDATRMAVSKAESMLGCSSRGKVVEVPDS